MLMVVFRRVQRRVYAAGVIPDNMRGSVPGENTQEASFLYDMYLDDEDLEAFMASVDVKGVFPNAPHRLIEVVWRQLGLPYGDFAGKYLRTRRYTVAAGKGCTEWVKPGPGVQQGGVGGSIPVDASHAPIDELDSTGVSTAAGGARHVTGAGVRG